MLTYKQAQQEILSFARSFGKEAVELNDALGRVLAEPISADRNYPPFNRAAMDGFAMDLSELEAGIRSFQIVETIFAGQVSRETIAYGQCYKIMTGAAVPGRANIIIRREDTMEENGHVRVEIDNFRVFQNIAKKGEDLSANEMVVDGNIIIKPSLVGLLASLGKPMIVVEKLPRLAIFTTGDEIIPVNQPVSEVQIRNSNRHLLQSLFANWGIRPELYEHIKDDKEQLYETLKTAMELDILVLCGGVSAGDADYVPGVLEKLEVKKLFHKVAIKPGKPIWCGLAPGGGFVFALPGNPFSCMVTFTLFIETYLMQCFGLQPKVSFRFPLSKGRIKKTSLDEFFPVRLLGPVPRLEAIYFNGSGDIRAGLWADGLAVQPADRDQLADGELVEFIGLGH